MVYDVPRNFLGDVHWTNGDELQEGDEMTLDKGGIMVQVAERVGETETDISGLIQRKDKTPAKAPASTRTMLRAQTPRGVASSIMTRTPIGTAQLPMKHKSLNALLGGNARRPIGKASLPVESPYEARIRDQENAQRESPRPTKRLRVDEPSSMMAQTPKALQNRDAAHMVKGDTTSHKSDSVSSKPKNVAEVIDISSDVEDSLQAPAIEAELLSTSSPARFLESPARVHLRSSRPIDRRTVAADPIVSESPSVRVQNRARIVVPPATVALPPVVKQAKEAIVVKEPVATTSSRKSAIDARAAQQGNHAPIDSDSQKKGKSLKLVSGAPRKMLVFQSQIVCVGGGGRELRGAGLGGLRGLVVV